MDSEPQTTLWVVIIITLLCSAFFSGMEIAFVSANRIKIEVDRKRGSTAGRILSFFVKNTGRFISFMLLGNNVALVVYGIYMGLLLEPPIGELVGDNVALILLIQTILSTLIVLITAEFLPKAIFRINPNGALNIAAIPLFLLYWVFYLPTLIIMSFSNFFLRIMKTDIEDSQQVFTKVDLDHYVSDLTDRIEEDAHMENELLILKNASNFSQVKARDCMVPRTEIVACNIEDDIAELKEKFIATGLSKILIYRDSIDNIIGYVHAYELFSKPETIKSIMLPIGIAPEAILVTQLMEDLTKQGRNIVLIVDEFGGTAGIVTIEDIIEEIFGEIEDEHDQYKDVEQQVDESTFIFSGRTEIDYLIQNHGLPLETSDEYETLAGLVIDRLEEIPEVNEQVETSKLMLTVLEVSDSKIDLVKIELKD